MGELVFFVTLYDLTARSKKILVSFTLEAPSQDEAQGIAFETLKKHDIYRTNIDVRDFVLFIELGGETAGHEFDVLPEALRRVRLEIRPIKKEGRRRCGLGCAGPRDGNCS